jgi:hypothetical protein
MLKAVSFLRRALHVPTTEELELNYLNDAVSGIDLEMRQRQVDAGMFRRTARSYY